MEVADKFGKKKSTYLATGQDMSWKAEMKFSVYRSLVVETWPLSESQKLQRRSKHSEKPQRVEESAVAKVEVAEEEKRKEAKKKPKRAWVGKRVEAQTREYSKVEAGVKMKMKRKMKTKRE